MRLRASISALSCGYLWRRLSKVLCSLIIAQLALFAGGCANKSENVAPDAPPTIAFSTTSLSFPSTTVGNAAPVAALTITDSGALPLTMAGAVLSDSSDFSLTNNCGATLAASASCTFAILFHPQVAGSFSATLTLTDDSGGSNGAQQVITLTGVGTPVPLPQVLLVPTSLTFPQTPIGTGATPQTVTLSNPGTAMLVISGVVLSDTVNYSVTTTCGAALAPSVSCSFSISFQPGTIGSLDAMLTLTDNAGAETGTTQQSISLTGTGAPPPVPQGFLASPGLLFPATIVGASSSAQPVTLTNTGTAPLTIGKYLLSDTADFSIATTCGAMVAPGGSCIFSVLFHPQSVGLLNTTLTVTDNSGGGVGVQQALTLSGTGLPVPVPQATVAPSSLSFPQTISNSLSTARTLTLSNTGTAPLVISGVTISGANASAFILGVGGCDEILAVGSSCTETLTYAPTAASIADTASLVFTDNSAGMVGSTQVVSLTGSALAEVDSVTNFGDSITCGFYAQPNDGTNNVYSTQGYAGLFDRFVGARAENYCRQGDEAADLSRVWVPFYSSPALGANQLYTVMIGTNNAYRYGVGPLNLGSYNHEVGAALAWLGMPATDKVLANTISERTGTWTSDTGFGLTSSDAAASLTFNVNQAVAGRNLYVVYHVYFVALGQAGTASISVDGIAQATVDESEGSGFGPPTQNGTSDSYFLQTVPLGAAGAHTVTFTSSGTPVSPVALLWAGVPQGDYTVIAGAPRVLVGAITNSPSGNQTYSTDVYNIQLRSLVSSLIADGMNITVVPTDAVLDPGTDFVDLLHPNNAGHAKLAAAFEKFR